ncbi:hypothetical protein P154DRAFT_615757 [Amniculicola lignicola CBS 123094]|uniref:EthD domain-containing protein n=1 Tax=Amniculicola lignicola CBS 123094 TaxID=1392246 RepID=A0A6A5WVH4_9PLEO|nr:hypothetical protein P154DRAFT_615757 [Amniculicola lignicola CBS 123094]
MAPTKETVLKLSSCRYKHPDVSDQEFHDYASNFVAARAAAIALKHGVLKMSQYHSPSSVKALTSADGPLFWALAPGFNILPYDLYIEIWVRKAEDLTAMVTDPDFQALVAEEGPKAVNDRGDWIIGWDEVYIEDGKIVNVEGKESAYATYEEKVAAVVGGK